MTTIYHYHPDTKEFLRDGEARLDPLEGKPLIPGFATTVAPPVMGNDEAAVCIGGTWQIVPDYRGLTYWLTDKSEHTIDQLGIAPPEGALDAPPPATIDELKAQATEKVLMFAADTRAKITGRVDQYKLAGWNDKFQRAQRVLTDTATEADIATLQTECDRRGKSETPQELAHKQATKGQALATAAAIIDGLESSALEAIESKQSENTLAALLDDLQAQANAELEQLLGVHNADA